MVYRGRSGADPEKKGEDVFPMFVVFVIVSVSVLSTKTTFGPGLCPVAYRAQNTFR